jgi:hypothetical protein
MLEFVPRSKSKRLPVPWRHRDAATAKSVPLSGTSHLSRRLAPRLIGPVLALLIGVLLAGCDEGTEDRIREKKEVFITLTPAQQKKIVDGVFEVGDTADMVYMAIGSPLRVKSKAIPEGTIEMWTYVNFFSVPGASRIVVNNPYASQYTSNQRDPQRDLTETLAVPQTASNTLYVFFLNGRVAQIKLDTEGRR